MVIKAKEVKKYCQGYCKIEATQGKVRVLPLACSILKSPRELPIIPGH